MFRGSFVSLFMHVRTFSLQICLVYSTSKRIGFVLRRIIYQSPLHNSVLSCGFSISRPLILPSNDSKHLLWSCAASVDSKRKYPSCWIVLMINWVYTRSTPSAISRVSRRQCLETEKAYSDCNISQEALYTGASIANVDGEIDAWSNLLVNVINALSPRSCERVFNLSRHFDEICSNSETSRCYWNFRWL